MTLVIASGPDLTNNPSLVIIGNVTLPSDVVMSFPGVKILGMAQILDGVSTIQRISRKPVEIEFEFTLREYTQPGTLNSNFTSTVFPQDLYDNLWQNVFLPNSVQNIQNTQLNKIGIQQIVIEKITPTTIRGSKNMPVRITAYENVPGQTLIVSN